MLVASAALATVFLLLSAPAAAQDNARARLEAAARTSLGGPASAQAQQEEDRLRRLEESRTPLLDRAFDPVETLRDRLRENTGLSLSADYQALYQRTSHSITDEKEGAAGNARLLGTWTLLNRGGKDTGSLVFVLENRHRLGSELSAADLGGVIGYKGAQAVTFDDANSSLSVAHWAQYLGGGRGAVVAGRIDPSDYTDILGYVNPRTTFQNYSILFSPVVPLPDAGFGVGGGVFLTDQIYTLGVVSDANGSLTDVKWFPGGSEFFKYAELGWTPAPDQRYVTNVHVGVFHVDAREDAGLPSNRGVTVSGNYTFGQSFMVFGRLGWADGATSIAERAVNAGLLWRPGWYDDLVGAGVTVADLSDESLDTQTTVEAFYRLDVSDNVAATGSVQYLRNPGFSTSDPWLFGIRLRVNL
jgi:porin